MHHVPSPSLAATLRALRGETDLQIIAPVLRDPRFARILALAPNVDPVVGAHGALAGALPDLLTPAVRDSPALSAAIASLIGTEAGNDILKAWADVAPVGWGASHTDALIDAVRCNRCRPWAAAALIGPSADAASLLYETWDIVRAIRWWGQATPDDPTAWMDDLASAERDRLVHALRTVPGNAAACCPWLPDAIAADIISRIDKPFLPSALTAYAAASPAARAHHADVLTTLIQHARWNHLADLTRLAVVAGMDAVWATVVRILHDDPWSAIAVITETPWNNLDAKVQTTILSAAPHNDVCAAIAFARGVRKRPPPTTGTTARAFFAAVTPKVWNALPMEMQRVWCTQLAAWHMPLAVRSLGPDPTFLARAYLNADVIAAVRCHFHDDGDLRHTLLPVAVRDLPLIAVPDIVGALLPPPDPVAFVQIVCGEREMPPALHDWIVAHPMLHAYGTAATILRAAEQSDAIADRCAALAAALADRSREETDALLAALPDDAHAALRPDSNALACALAHPDRRDAFRQALDARDALPLSAALPARHALDALAQTTTPSDQRHAGETLATVLRNHGSIFADIVGALNDAARSAVLPRLNDPHIESALDDLAAADPLVAHHLAYALRDDDAAVALDALAAASFARLTRIWYILPDAFQHAVLGDRNAILTAAAAPGRVDDLAQALRNWDADVPLPWLALRMLIDDDAERREQGMAILAQQPDRAAALLPLLRDDLCTALESVPAIAFACADLPLDRRRASVSARRRR